MFLLLINLFLLLIAFVSYKMMKGKVGILFDSDGNFHFFGILGCILFTIINSIFYPIFYGFNNLGSVVLLPLFVPVGALIFHLIDNAKENERERK